jgi:hypothetical protein
LSTDAGRLHNEAGKRRRVILPVAAPPLAPFSVFHASWNETAHELARLSENWPPD